MGNFAHQCRFVDPHFGRLDAHPLHYFVATETADHHCLADSRQFDFHCFDFADYLRFQIDPEDCHRHFVAATAAVGAVAFSMLQARPYSLRHLCGRGLSIMPVDIVQWLHRDRPF